MIKNLKIKIIFADLKYLVLPFYVLQPCVINLPVFKVQIVIKFVTLNPNPNPITQDENQILLPFSNFTSGQSKNLSVPTIWFFFNRDLW